MEVPAKMELEVLLERGLHERGIAFGEREYDEDWAILPEERIEYPCIIFTRCSADRYGVAITYTVTPVAALSSVDDDPKLLISQGKVQDELIEVEYSAGIDDETKEAIYITIASLLVNHDTNSPLVSAEIFPTYLQQAIALGLPDPVVRAIARMQDVSVDSSAAQIASLALSCLDYKLS
ncbi:hypothetical protein HYS47_03675 [Candidatus Woesearchaeota archaeon]|nr:hypothetical protein [Candidatus Woesearchaeota archaeon]